MKKMTNNLSVIKKGSFLAVVGAALFSLTLGTTSAFAAEQTFSDGQNTGDVIINGTLGADNTKENAVIPEGSDSWINITVDTATIFYNTSSSFDIQSPNYNITNNSGRPVAVGISSFTQTGSADISSISSLAVNTTRSKSGTTDSAGQTTNTNLITDGNLTDFSTPVSIITLANSNGKIAKDDVNNSYGKSATFNYTGTVSTKLSSTISPEFTMTLQFTPQSW